MKGSHLQTFRLSKGWHVNQLASAMGMEPEKIRIAENQDSTLSIKEMSILVNLLSEIQSTMHISERVRFFLEKHELTRNEMGILIDVTKTTVHRMLAGGPVGAELISAFMKLELMSKPDLAHLLATKKETWVVPTKKTWNDKLRKRREANILASKQDNPQVATSEVSHFLPDDHLKEDRRLLHPFERKIHKGGGPYARDLMLACGWTKSYFALMVGTAPSMLARWFSGNGTPNRNQKDKMVTIGRWVSDHQKRPTHQQISEIMTEFKIAHFDADLERKEAENHHTLNQAEKEPVVKTDSFTDNYVNTDMVYREIMTTNKQINSLKTIVVTSVTLHIIGVLITLFSTGAFRIAP